MLEDEKIIDVGEADEQEMEIDLDAPEQSLDIPEEEIKVEQVSEDDNQSDDTSEKSDEQSAAQEDKPKDELGEYSEGVKKRIAKLTRKMREAERQKEEAIQYAQQIKTQADQFKGQYEQLGGQYTNELEAKVSNGMEAAKLAYKQAIETQDIDAQVKAQQAIAQMAMEEARLKSIRASQEQRTQAPEQVAEQQQAAPQQPAQAEFDPRAEEWAQKNKWFGTDNAMTYTAFDIHKELVESEGFDPQSAEYYTEVDKRIRVAFPHKFDTVDQSAPAPTQSVASAKRPAAKGRRKTVKLTPSQVAISKRLGVPLEEYAKQLAAKEV
mgnify:FL=1